MDAQASVRRAREASQAGLEGLRPRRRCRGRGKRRESPRSGYRSGPRPDLRIRPGTRPSKVAGGLARSRLEEGRKAGACFGLEPGERIRFALLSNRGEEEGFALFPSQAKREGSPSRGAARRGGGFRPNSPPTGSAGAFALRARPTGAERGFASLRTPPTQRVIARPRRRDREPGTSGAGGDAGPHVVFGSKRYFEPGLPPLDSPP
ncbi:MAG: hypothetical protein QOJ94_2023 [Sphingomonadales bacterium]|jgi:hypothetical protein|nr:hypothetical protein [Sphingomonadales bacterium]